MVTGGLKRTAQSVALRSTQVWERNKKQILGFRMAQNDTSPKGERGSDANVGAGPVRLPRPSGRPFIKFVEAGGDPHSFAGVVTRNSPQAMFVWITDIIKVKDLAPCPWCSPRMGKFLRGRLCWFENEGVARFVGWECAKSHLDGDLLRDADAKWTGERRQERCNAFLRANCDRAARLVEMVVAFEGAAAVCDNFHRDFAKGRHTADIYEEMRGKVRNGELRAVRVGPGRGIDLVGVLRGVSVFKGNPNLRKKLDVVRIQRHTWDPETS